MPVAGRLAVAAERTSGLPAPEHPGAAVAAKAQLSAAGSSLATSSEVETPRALDAVYLGAFAGRRGAHDEVSAPAAVADAPTPSARLARPSALPAASLGRAAEPAVAAAAEPEAPVKVPRALWGLIVGDVLMTIGYYMHILSQPFLVQGLTGSSAAVGLIRNVHYASYTASSFFSLGTVVDKTDYGTLMAGSYLIRALLMGAIPLLFVTGHLTLATLAVVVAINPFFQNISTTTDESAQISILGTDERVINKGKALVTKTLALANLLPLVSGLLVGWLVAAFGATAGYAYAYAGYAAFLLLAVPFLQVLLADPRHADPNVQEKPSRNWLNLLLPIRAVLETLAFASGATETIRTVRRRYLAGPWSLRKALAAAALAASAPLWLVVGGVVVQVRRLGRAFSSARGALASYRTARAAADASDGGAASAKVRLRERLARLFERFEATRGVSFILRNNVLWILSLVATANLFLADALDFVVMPNFIAQVLVPRLDLAWVPVVGGLLSTSAGVFTLLIIAGSAAALLVTRFFEGDGGLARIRRLGHRALYRVAALGSASFLLLLIPAFFLAPSPELRSLLEIGYRLMEDPATKAEGAAIVSRVLEQLPLWKFGAGLGITLLVQFLTSLLQIPLLLAMAPVRNKQIPPEKVGSVITAFTIIEVVLMGAGSLVLGVLVDAFTIQIAMLVVMGFVGASALLEWLVPGWLSKEKPEGWYEAARRPPASQPTSGP